jgi:hypothetical protein
MSKSPVSISTNLVCSQISVVSLKWWLGKRQVSQGPNGVSFEHVPLEVNCSQRLGAVFFHKKIGVLVGDFDRKVFKVTIPKRKDIGLLESAKQSISCYPCTAATYVESVAILAHESARITLFS